MTGSVLMHHFAHSFHPGVIALHHPLHPAVALLHTLAHLVHPHTRTRPVASVLDMGVSDAARNRDSGRDQCGYQQSFLHVSSVRDSTY